MSEEAAITFSIGDHFTFTAELAMSIDAAREVLRQRCGLEPHFQAKIGPSTIIGNEIATPITPVDDAYLNFQVSIPIPGVKHYHLVGYFK